MLNKIAARTKLKIENEKIRQPLQSIKEQIEVGTFAFGKRLRESKWSLIAECKLSSPVKGRLCATYSVPELALMYTASGAAALSVHTNSHFSGDLKDIKLVRKLSELPILRKEFIVDSYQIYESRAVGADAILLIAAILTDSQLNEYLAIADSLGMDCLVEVHTKEELERVLATSAQFIGINNRNLQTFRTNISNTFELAPYFDAKRIYISESGIKTGSDAWQLHKAGVRGILVGEGLVKADDIAAKTRELSTI